MNIRLLFRKTIDLWRRDGLLACFYSAAKYLATEKTEKADTFDLKWGTDTSGIVPLWKLKLATTQAAFGHRYEATDGEELESAVTVLGEDLSTFTFVDLGCGKGRTLIVASRLGFGHVVGIEFASELVDTARNNMAKLGLTEAVIALGDVADFQFPDTNLVVYLFNPFSEEVMHKVLDNLRQSAGRRVYVIYNSPKCASVLDSSGFLDRFAAPLATKWTIQIWRRTFS